MPKVLILLLSCYFSIAQLNGGSLSLDFSSYFDSSGYSVSYKGVGDLYSAGIIVSQSATKHSIKYDAGRQNYFTGNFSLPTTSSNPYGLSNSRKITATHAVNNISVEIIASPSKTTKDFIIIDYIVENTGSTEMKDVYIGVPMDWDLGVDYLDDGTGYNSSAKTAYAYDSDFFGTPAYYFGTRTLSHSVSGYYASTGGGVFTDNLYNQKMRTISSGIQNSDVSYILSSGPITIAAGAKVRFSYALIAGDNLSDLLSNGSAAQSVYNSIDQVKPVLIPTVQFSSEPSLSHHLNFFVKSNEALASNPIVTINSRLLPSENVTAFDASSYMYKATYLADFTENVTFRVQGTDNFGNVGNATKAISLGQFGVTNSKIEISPSTNLVTNNSIQTKTPIAVEHTERSQENGNFTQKTKAYKIVAFGAKESLELRTNLKTLDNATKPMNYSYFKHKNDEWTPAGGRLEGNELVLDLEDLTAEYAVFYSDFSQIQPNSIQIEQNYPNPFNPSTTIGFTLKNANRVKVEVFNSLGQFVQLLSEREFSEGTHSVMWYGKNSAGVQMPSGVYFYRVSIGNNVYSNKMILMK